MFDRLGWMALLLTLVPAAVRYHRTRSLLRHIDDPTLPERLLGSRNLISLAFVFSIVVAIAIRPPLAPVLLVVQIVAFALAGWPLRRALFAETWSFPAYLWFYVRLTVAIYGFWLLLISSIWLTGVEGLRGWIAAAVLGVVLLVYNEKYAAVLAFILRTTPVTSPALLDRFNAIIANTPVTPPHIDYVDMRGGVLVNAIALPDVRKATVLFTSSLLERLDEDEIVAIFAHEVAHLEHYNPAYLRKLLWGARLLIVVTVAIHPFINTFTPAFGSLVSFWPIVVVAYMVIRGRHKQKHETESDLRSAELTGDPEVMVRALVKLYELMKLPRRLDPSVEVHASHPSLARRMQALRAAGGSSETLQEPVTLRHESITVTLHQDRVIWSEGEVAAYTLAYSALDELRIVADQRGTMRLVASDPAGRKWSLPLAQEDVPRAHAALNVVDVKLRPSPAAVSKWELIGRLSALLCFIASLITMQFASILVAVFAAIKFEPPLARAAAVAGLLGGIFALRDGLVPASGWILILSAGLLLFITTRDRREAASPITWQLVAVIGCFALLTAIPVAMAAHNWLTLHKAARTWPSLAMLSLAFAAANLTRRSTGWRIAIVLTASVGLASMALGTIRAIDTLVDDPFLSRLPRTPTVPFPDVPDSRFDIGFVPQQVFLSPNALSIAAIDEADYEESVLQVGRPGRTLAEVSGEAALFVDDDRLLLLEGHRGTSRVRLVHVDQPETAIWTTEAPVWGARLSVSSDGQRWQLLGTNMSGEFARVTGSMAGVVSATDTWPAPAPPDNGRLSPLTAHDDRLLVQQAAWNRYGLGLEGRWNTWIDPWRTDTRVLTIDRAGQREMLHSVLAIDCRPPPIIEDEPICSAQDSSRTHVFRISPDATLTSFAMLDGRVAVDVTRSWILGWAPRPYALHRESGRLYELDSRRGFFAGGDTVVGVVSSRDDSATVELYRLNAR